MSLRGRTILEEPGSDGINHIEAGLGSYISLCGITLRPGEVERVPYETHNDGWGQSHEYFCADCVSVKNRRAVEGNGGVLS